MFTLQIQEVEGRFKSQLAKRIKMFNRAAGSLLEAESEVSQALQRLNSEGLQMQAASENDRKGADLLAEWHQLRCRRLDLLRAHRNLLNDRIDIFDQVSDALRIMVENQHELVNETIERVKAKLTEAGAGIDTIFGAAGGRLIDIDPKAASIQFNHRARKNNEVTPLLDQLQNLEAEKGGAGVQLRMTREEIERVEGQLRSLWGSLSGGMPAFAN